MDLQEFYGAVASLWVVWFFLLFAGIVAWVYWPRRRKQMQERAMIPLRDDEKPDDAKK